MNYALHRHASKAHRTQAVSPSFNPHNLGTPTNTGSVAVHDKTLSRDYIPGYYPDLQLTKSDLTLGPNLTVSTDSSSGLTIYPPQRPVLFGSKNYAGGSEGGGSGAWESAYLPEGWYGLVAPGQAIWGAVPDRRQLLQASMGSVVSVAYGQSCISLTARYVLRRSGADNERTAIHRAALLVPAHRREMPRTAQLGLASVRQVGPDRPVRPVRQGITAHPAWVSCDLFHFEWNQLKTACPENCTICDDGLAGTGSCLRTMTNSSESGFASATALKFSMQLFARHLFTLWRLPMLRWMDHQRNCI